MRTDGRIDRRSEDYKFSFIKKIIIVPLQLELTPSLHSSLRQPNSLGMAGNLMTSALRRNVLGAHLSASRAATGPFHRMAPSLVASQQSFSTSFGSTPIVMQSASDESSYAKDVTPMEGEVAAVNLYDGHYSDHLKEAQTKVRTDTYGPDGERPPQKKNCTHPFKVGESAAAPSRCRHFIRVVIAWG